MTKNIYLSEETMSLSEAMTEAATILAKYNWYEEVRIYARNNNRKCIRVIRSNK